MPKLSAAIAVYKIINKKPMLFLVHPGGPFWAKKDEGSWSLPKGEYLESEDAWEAAKREFKEETGHIPPAGEPVLLGEVRYNNKKVTAWALEGDVEARNITSNVFELEWPPNSGKKQAFPEVDRAGWFSFDEAKQKLVKGQVSLVSRLELLIKK